MLLFIFVPKSRLFLGSYHANGVPECMYKLAQKQGITISSYDYNEAQLVSYSTSSLFFITICFISRARTNVTGRQRISKTAQTDF